MKKTVYIHSYEEVKASFEERLKINQSRSSEEILYPSLVGTIEAIVDMNTTPSAKVQSIKNCIKAFNDLTR